MLTNNELLQLYLEDLNLPDAHHGFRKKAHNPQHWNIPPVCKLEFIDINKCIANKRNVFVFSDIHFYHKNIIKYSNRPFPTYDLMNKCIIGNYLNVVQENDIVFWLGDITFGHVSEVNDILLRLPGYKIHILGNHDMDRKGKLTNLLFDERHSCYTINVDEPDQSYQLVLTHYPMDKVPPNCVNVHGHIHQHKMPSVLNINACVEHTNYTPRNLTDIIEQANAAIGLYA